MYLPSQYFGVSQSDKLGRCLSRVRVPPNQHIERFLKPRGIPMQIIDANDFTTTKLLERIHANV